MEDYQGKAVAKMTCSIPTCYWENATGLFASVASGQKVCPGAISFRACRKPLLEVPGSMALACMETDVVLVQVADIYIGKIPTEIKGVQYSNRFAPSYWLLRLRLGGSWGFWIASCISLSVYDGLYLMVFKDNSCYICCCLRSMVNCGAWEPVSQAFERWQIH